MPTVALVAGMAILFYYDDHDPPHFHARGADFLARVLISDGAIMDISGRMTARESRIIRRWAAKHRKALMENWTLARRDRPLLKIESEL
jgi:hypothetical protein